MVIYRNNPTGRKYTLIAEGKSTKINSGGKSITVNHPLDMISQAWFNWQMSGQFIQVAFDFLNPDEREFLITGITPEEWKKLFPDGDK